MVLKAVQKGGQTGHPLSFFLSFGQIFSLPSWVFFFLLSRFIVSRFVFRGVCYPFPSPAQRTMERIGHNIFSCNFGCRLVDLIITYPSTYIHAYIRRGMCDLLNTHKYDPRIADSLRVALKD